MNLRPVTLGQLIDRTLEELQAPAEVGLQTVLAEPLTASGTSFTLVDATKLNGSDLVEVGSELMLVTHKSDDPIPVVTVSRGYYGSTVSHHASGSVATINPQHARIRVGAAVQRAFPRLEALGLPLIVSDTYLPVTDNRYIELPEETREVVRVSYVSPQNGVWSDLSAWEFIDNVPQAKYPTGKILRTQRWILNDTELEVSIRVPYRWSSFPDPPEEDDEIQIMEGAEDLPSIYAAAWIASRREISRSQIDRSEEWNAGEPMRGGVSATLVRVLWQEFYRALDEARRITVQPAVRHYKRMPRIR